jgi:hypothetical protein
MYSVFGDICRTGNLPIAGTVFILDSPVQRNAHVPSRRIVHGLVRIISHRFQQVFLTRICLYMAYSCMSVTSLTKNFAYKTLV